MTETVHTLSRQEVIHRRALAAMGILVVFTVIVTAFAAWTGTGKRYAPSAEIVSAAELRFEDRTDGVVAVLDGETGAEIAIYGIDEGVFVRSVMRGIARQRRLRGDLSQGPVRLSQHANGELWLSDPAHEIHIYLGAFGRDNHRAWTQLLGRDAQLAEGPPTEGDPS